MAGECRDAAAYYLATPHQHQQSSRPGASVDWTISGRVPRVRSGRPPCLGREQPSQNQLAQERLHQGFEPKGTPEESARCPGRPSFLRPRQAEPARSSGIHAPDRLPARPARVRGRSHHPARLRRCGRTNEHAVADRRSGKDEGQIGAEGVPVNSDCVLDRHVCSDLRSTSTSVEVFNQDDFVALLVDQRARGVRCRWACVSSASLLRPAQQPGCASRHNRWDQRSGGVFCRPK